MATPGRRVSTPPKRQTGNLTALYIGAAIVVVAVLALFFRPTAISHVRNLDSRGTNIVAFGDSLTAGVGASADQNYPSRLSEALGTPVANAGISGDTTGAALARIERDVLSLEPRIVLVGLGGNDFLRNIPISTTESNLRQIINRVQAGGAMVVLLGYRFPSFQANYEEMYERVAEEQGCLLIPDLLDGILSDPQLRADAIHPNGKGYAVMVERIEGSLSNLIEAADKARP
jgi:acyl-CoA thioesterase-1